MAWQPVPPHSVRDRTAADFLCLFVRSCFLCANVSGHQSLQDAERHPNLFPGPKWDSRTTLSHLSPGNLSADYQVIDVRGFLLRNPNRLRLTRISSFSELDLSVSAKTIKQKVQGHLMASGRRMQYPFPGPKWDSETVSSHLSPGNCSLTICGPQEYPLSLNTVYKSVLFRFMSQIAPAKIINKQAVMYLKTSGRRIPGTISGTEMGHIHQCSPI